MRNRNRNIVQIHRSRLWNNVLVFNKDKSILTELPMDSKMERMLHGRCKMYCTCHRDIAGRLVIGEEVKADW